MSKLTDAIREQNPGVYDNMSDAELEAYAAKLSPAYQAEIEKERGMPLGGVPEKFSGGAPGAIPDPEQVQPPGMDSTRHALDTRPHPGPWAADIGLGIEGFNRGMSDAAGAMMVPLAGAAGTAGGALVGGPLGAMAGGGSAAAGAEALRQWMRQAHRPWERDEPLDTGDVMMAGATNMVPGAAQGVSKLGLPMMRRALARAPAFLRANPAAPATMVEGGITATPQGAAKAGGIAKGARDVLARGRGVRVPQTQGPGGQFVRGPLTPRGQALTDRAAGHEAIDTGVMDMLQTQTPRTFPQTMIDLAIAGAGPGVGIWKGQGLTGALLSAGILGAKALYNSPSAMSRGAVAVNRLGRPLSQEALRYLSMLMELGVGGDEEKK